MAAPRKPRGRPRKDRHAMDDGKGHKSWDFTCNHLFDDDGNVILPVYDALMLLSREDMSAKMMIAKEQAPNTGKWHGQGRVCYRRNYRFDAVQKILAGCHCEATKCAQDWCYFAKLDSVNVIDVDNRKQGKRNVFKEQLSGIKDGATLQDCCDYEGANYQSLRTAELLMKYIEPDRPSTPRVVELVVKPAPPTGAYIVNSFWDGYDAHKAIFINQRLCNFSVPMLRTISRQYPFRVGRLGRQARFDRVTFYGLDAAEREALGYK